MKSGFKRFAVLGFVIICQSSLSFAGWKDVYLDAIRAAFKADGETVRKIVSPLYSGDQVSILTEQDAQGKTVLHLLAENRNSETIVQLIKPMYSGDQIQLDGKKR